MRLMGAYRVFTTASSVEQVEDELLELRESDLTLSLRVHFIKGDLQLLLVHVLRPAKEGIKFLKADALVFVKVDLAEDLLKALLGQELLLVDAYHHELIEADQTISRAVGHRDQVVHTLLIEVGPEVLTIALDQLFT